MTQWQTQSGKGTSSWVMTEFMCDPLAWIIMCLYIVCVCVSHLLHFCVTSPAPAAKLLTPFAPDSKHICQHTFSLSFSLSLFLALKKNLLWINSRSIHLSRSPSLSLSSSSLYEFIMFPLSLYHHISLHPSLSLSKCSRQLLSKLNFNQGWGVSSSGCVACTTTQCFFSLWQ